MVSINFDKEFRFGEKKEKVLVFTPKVEHKTKRFEKVTKTRLKAYMEKLHTWWRLDIYAGEQLPS